jgi:hypothetical protein
VLPPQRRVKTQRHRQRLHQCDRSELQHGRAADGGVVRVPGSGTAGARARGGDARRVPVFEQLGYREEQKAAGFVFVMWKGVQQHHAEADKLYFAGNVHDIEAGNLLLVECKAAEKEPDADRGQASSYAF